MLFSFWLVPAEQLSEEKAGLTALENEIKEFLCT